VHTFHFEAISVTMNTVLKFCIKTPIRKATMGCMTRTRFLAEEKKKSDKV